MDNEKRDKSQEVLKKSNVDSEGSSLNQTVFQSVETKLILDSDVILAKETRLQLDECMAKLRHHKTIYVDWGFAAVDPLGMSTILNFYGPPGTGKTLAAQALAGTLGLPIIQIGIAEIESKMMGDSAKNIQSAFQSARLSGAVLFFDEADTLLGKRLSSVTQGVDNEVNAMRSTLLIELERFDGIVIFATNFAKNYDEAFRSRIGHHIHFALPDHDARIRLWDRMFVPNLPVAQDRNDMILMCAEKSDGFSGRDIRTCMRLALPKVLLEAERNEGASELTVAHIQTAIEQIRIAHTEVAVSVTSRSQQREVSTAKSLLGISS